MIDPTERDREMEIDMKYRIAENPWNLKSAPWRDAIGIEDVSDQDLAVPPVICWFTRPSDDAANMAHLICRLLNKTEPTERDREIAARRYDAAMRRARDIGEEEKGPLAFIIGKTLREEIILELIQAREEGRRETTA